VALTALVVIAAVAAAGLIAAWVDSPSGSLRWAAIAAIAAVGTLGLAAVAGIVAVLAYKNAAQRPELYAELWVPVRLGNDEVREIQRPLRLPIGKGERLVVGPVEPTWVLRPLDLCLSLRNDGTASARNVSVDVRLRNLVCPPESLTLPMGWSVVSEETDIAWGVRRVVWEGGADLVIHGYGHERTWRLGFETWAASQTASPVVDVHVVADGFPRKRFRFPAEVGGAQPPRVSALIAHAE
jgi:hypothetical protein